MKSREEYQASIYAKRDAFLKKRKSRISQAVAVFCLVICFAAVFNFVPQKLKSGSSLIESQSIITSHENDLVMAEDVYNPMNRVSEKSEAITEPAGAVINGVYSPEALTTASSMDELAVEETKKPFGYIPQKATSFGEAELADGTPPEKSRKKYSDKDAEAEAYKYIPVDERANIIEDKTEIIITHSANGDEYYSVYIYTDEKLYIIKIDAYTSDKIGFTEKEISAERDIHTTPAHFPEGTTAAAAYMPNQ